MMSHEHRTGAVGTYHHHSSSALPVELFHGVSSFADDVQRKLDLHDFYEAQN